MAGDQKQAAIIEAAIKRFAHFGVSKTTMNEIATDLSISKALLYYYFPDKISLYAAVLQSITERSIEEERGKLAQEPDPRKAIMLYLEMRTNVIIRYHNILEHLKNYSPQNLPKELQPLFNSFRALDLQRITDLIIRGKEAGILKSQDPARDAELYLDFLEAYRFAAFGKTPNLFPDKEQFQALLQQEKAFSSIFFNGLTCER